MDAALVYYGNPVPYTGNLALAASVDLKLPRRIIDEVRAAVARFSLHADEAGVPKRLAATVARALAQLR